MGFPQKFEVLLASKGLSAAAFAKACKCKTSESTVRRWANGETEPSLAEAYEIGKYFDVSLEYLADDSFIEPPDFSDVRKEIAKIVNAIGPLAAHARLTLGDTTLGAGPIGRLDTHGRPDNHDSKRKK